MAENDAFIELVETVMRERGLNKAQVAKLAGVDRSKVSRLLSGGTKRVAAADRDKILGALGLQPGGQRPFTYRKAQSIKNIGVDGTLSTWVYHEILAHGVCSQLEHTVDVTSEELVGDTPVRPLESRVTADVNEGNHALTLHLDDYYRNELNYHIDIHPPLQPGELLVYCRRFTVPNYFPLRRSEIAERSARPGFPRRLKLYEPQGHLCYGFCWDVLSPTESLELVIHFPRLVRLRHHFAHAATCSRTSFGETPNESETQRCLRPEHLRCQPGRHGQGPTLELTIPRPLLNTTYTLLYEPDAE